MPLQSPELTPLPNASSMPDPGPIRWRRFAEAAAYAPEIHTDQTRKGSETPYVAHLLGVASLVLEYGGEEDQAIAGLLHDAIEDVGPEQEKIIAERFGPRVAAIVRGCTDAIVRPKPPWRARKEAYIAHLADADSDVLLVAAADKLYNARAIVADLRTFGLAVFDRFQGGEAGTIWYYQTLAREFMRLLPGPLSAELSEAAGEMVRLTGSAKVHCHRCGQPISRQSIRITGNNNEMRLKEGT
jgi:(p)ppGpp synthase/HD superfamily hydrolase